MVIARFDERTRLDHIDPKVQLLGAELIPHAAAPPQCRGLLDLGQPDQIAVEGARCRLATSRNRNLHVVQRHHAEDGLTHEMDATRKRGSRPDR